MKKKILLLFMFIFLTTFVYGITCSQNPDDYTLYDTFEDNDVSDWTESAGGVFQSGASYALNGSYGAWYYTNKELGDDRELGFYKDISASQEKFTAEFYIQPKETTKDKIIAIGSSKANGFFLYFSATTQKIQVLDGTVTFRDCTATYNADTWYAVKLQINFTDDKMAVYINDVFQPTCSGYTSFGNPTLNSFWLSGPGGANNASYWIDTIRIYDGTECPVDAGNYHYPTPPSGNINNTQAIINVSCFSNSVTLWFDNNSNPTTKVFDGVTSPALYPTTVSFNDKYYYKSSCDGGLINESVRTWTFDNNTPTLTINSNNFFSVNKTHITANLNRVNLTFQDNLNLTFVKLNFTQQNNTRWFDYYTLKTNMFRYNKTINVSLWNSGEFNLSIEWYDGVNYATRYYTHYIDTFNLTVIGRNIITGVTLSDVNITLNNTYRGEGYNSLQNFSNLRYGLYRLNARKTGYNTYNENFTLTSTQTKYIEMGFNASFCFYDERTLDKFNILGTNSTIFLLYCPDATYQIELNKSVVNSTGCQSIPITCQYDKFKFVLNYGATSYYRTFILQPNEVFNVSVYLIDALNTEYLYSDFKIDDLLDTYNDLAIYIKKVIEGQTIQITADYIDIENKIGAYLILNNEYIVEVHSSNYPTRVVGTYSADIAGEKIIRLYDIGLYPQPSGFSNTVSMRMFFNNDTKKAYFIYNDSASQTESVMFEIREDSSTGALLYGPVTLNNQQNIEYDVDMSLYENTTFVGIATINHKEGGEHIVGKILNKVSEINLAIIDFIGQNLLNWIITLLLATLALMATIRTANMTSLAIIGLAAIFTLFGWYTISWSALALATLISILSILKEGGK